MSAPRPRGATSADGHAPLKMGTAVAPASTGGRAQIHQIWTSTNGPDLDLAAAQLGGSARDYVVRSPGSLSLPFGEVRIPFRGVQPIERLRVPGSRRCGATPSLASFGRRPYGRGGYRTASPPPAAAGPRRNVTDTAQCELVSAVSIAPGALIAGRRVTRTGPERRALSGSAPSPARARRRGPGHRPGPKRARRTSPSGSVRSREPAGRLRHTTVMLGELTFG
jgi:hypothetical protein